MDFPLKTIPRWSVTVLKVYIKKFYLESWSKYSKGVGILYLKENSREDVQYVQYLIFNYYKIVLKLASVWFPNLEGIVYSDVFKELRIQLDQKPSPKGKQQIWMFPKIGVPQNGWFIMENLMKMDDLWGTPIFGNTHMD